MGKFKQIRDSKILNIVLIILNIWLLIPLTIDFFVSPYIVDSRVLDEFANMMAGNLITVTLFFVLPIVNIVFFSSKRIFRSIISVLTILLLLPIFFLGIAMSFGP